MHYESTSNVDAPQATSTFEQIEYLAGFKEKWLKLDLLDNEIIHKSNTGSFTSGRCVDKAGEGIHPLDILLGQEIKFNENLMSENLKILTFFIVYYSL